MPNIIQLHIYLQSLKSIHSIHLKPFKILFEKSKMLFEKLKNCKYLLRIKMVFENNLKISSVYVHILFITVQFNSIKKNKTVKKIKSTII